MEIILSHQMSHLFSHLKKTQWIKSVVVARGVFNHYTHSFMGLDFKAEDIWFILIEVLREGRWGCNQKTTFSVVAMLKYFHHLF